MTSTVNARATTLDQPPSSDRGFFGHPRGLSTLFFTEMWERFSYYGLRPLLVLFMTAALANGGFGFDRTQASAIVGIYAASVYLASLPGGWVADRLLGLRRAIQYGAVFISAGHISIALSALGRSKVPFFLGLILIVIGTGLLKPNISAIVGDLYPEGGARRDAGFSIFYMGINLGATVGQIVTGWLGEKVGWHWGFGAAGVGMLIGLLVYTLRAPKTLGTIGLHPSRDPSPERQARQERNVKLGLTAGLGILALVVVLVATGVWSVNAAAVAESMAYVMAGTAIAYFAYIFTAGGLTSDEKKRVGVIFVLFLFAAIFWAAFEQAPTSLNLFARDFTDRQIGGFEVPASWFQSVNSLFIVLLAPFFAALWVTLGRRAHRRLEPGEVRSWLVSRRHWVSDDDLGGEPHPSGRCRYAGLAMVARGQLFLSDPRRDVPESRRAVVDDQAFAQEVRGPDDGHLVPGDRVRQPDRRTGGRARGSEPARADAQAVHDDDRLSDGLGSRARVAQHPHSENDGDDEDRRVRR